MSAEISYVYFLLCRIVGYKAEKMHLVVQRVGLTSVCKKLRTGLGGIVKLTLCSACICIPYCLGGLFNNRSDIGFVSAGFRDIAPKALGINGTVGVC